MSAPENCAAAKRGVRFYLPRVVYWLDKLGAAEPGRIRLSGCPRYLAHVWRRKARALRHAWERQRTLVDFPIRPGNNAWLRAVDQAQRPYPGTSSWLRSCSAAEGGWGRWVVHGGAPYYEGAEYDDISSGHLQFKPLTFKGFWRHAVEDLRARGYRVPRYASWVLAWRSATAQALAGAWGYTHGLRSHWFASIGRGC